MADGESTTAKVCCYCKQTLDRSLFSPDRRAKDGLQPRCRSCSNIARKQRYDADPERHRKAANDYFRANRERVLASNAKSRAKRADQIKAQKAAAYQKIKDDPAFKARIKAYTEARKAEKREYDRQYRAAHPELSARSIEWRKKNPEKRRSIIKAYTARRRSQEAKGDSTATVHAWEMAAKKVCYWCKVRCAKDYHVDHYVPLSKGGAHMVSNLVIACPRCNLKKNAKDPYEFAASVGRLF